MNPVMEIAVHIARDEKKLLFRRLFFFLQKESDSFDPTSKCWTFDPRPKGLEKDRTVTDIENELYPSPSQVQRQLEGIILSFEQEPFLPKLKIKGKGRQQGQTFDKRERYPVLKKEKKRK